MRGGQREEGHCERRRACEIPRHEGFCVRIQPSQNLPARPARIRRPRGYGFLERPRGQGPRLTWVAATKRFVILALTVIPFIPGYAAELRVADVADLSIEQLANIEVTSASRRAKCWSAAPD